MLPSSALAKLLATIFFLIGDGVIIASGYKIGFNIVVFQSSRDALVANNLLGRTNLLLWMVVLKHTFPIVAIFLPCLHKMNSKSKKYAVVQQTLAQANAGRRNSGVLKNIFSDLVATLS